MPHKHNGGRTKPSARCAFGRKLSSDSTHTQEQRVTHQWTRSGYRIKNSNHLSHEKKSLRSGTLYFGEERMVFSHKEVWTHYIWSGFSMELYLTKLYPETIMIMGRWESRAFLRYICIQFSDLRKGIITLITNKKALYTITEAEVFHHTPVHNDTDPQMMNLHRQGQ